MDAMQSQQVALERRNQRRVAAIDGALHRLETGDFGYCFICDEEIAIERLPFDPMLTRCIKCASWRQRLHFALRKGKKCECDR